jgi:hypothetical protein
VYVIGILSACVLNSAGTRRITNRINIFGFFGRCSDSRPKIALGKSNELLIPSETHYACARAYDDVTSLRELEKRYLIKITLPELATL